MYVLPTGSLKQHIGSFVHFFVPHMVYLAAFWVGSQGMVGGSKEGSWLKCFVGLLFQRGLKGGMGFPLKGFHQNLAS